MRNVIWKITTLNISSENLTSHWYRNLLTFYPKCSWRHSVTLARYSSTLWCCVTSASSSKDFPSSSPAKIYPKENTNWASCCHHSIPSSLSCIIYHYALKTFFLTCNTVLMNSLCNSICKQEDILIFSPATPTCSSLSMKKYSTCIGLSSLKNSSTSGSLFRVIRAGYS